ncbi:hypothetical protein [Actinomadura sp. 7K507]|uniref:hypothetical protein n=1 Tax=Actinomadura sp. 7K507 TaxID=2530365 RepID=UPI0014047D52|nr:hypothetical protein [Actinomadura sp. 7K507]
MVIALDRTIVTAADGPAHADGGRIDRARPHGGPGVSFSGAGGNLYELISPSRF